MARMRSALLMFLSMSVGVPSAAGAQAIESVRCLFSALNAHDFQAMTGCYSPSAVTVRGTSRNPVDFNADRGYREFEAATQALFRFDLTSATDSSADIVLHEESDFLIALGLTGVTADWRYLVRGGVIVEEHHLRADSAYAPRFREFVAWGRMNQPPQWQTVLDQNGNVVFNGTTANALVALARLWSAQRPPRDSGP